MSKKSLIVLGFEVLLTLFKMVLMHARVNIQVSFISWLGLTRIENTLNNFRLFHSLYRLKPMTVIFTGILARTLFSVSLHAVVAFSKKSPP